MIPLDVISIVSMFCFLVCWVLLSKWKWGLSITLIRKLLIYMYYASFVFGSVALTVRIVYLLNNRATPQTFSEFIEPLQKQYTSSGVPQVSTADSKDIKWITLPFVLMTLWLLLSVVVAFVVAHSSETLRFTPFVQIVAQSLFVLVRLLTNSNVSISLVFIEVFVFVFLFNLSLGFIINKQKLIHLKTLTDQVLLSKDIDQKRVQEANKIKKLREAVRRTTQMNKLMPNKDNLSKKLKAVENLYDAIHMNDFHKQLKLEELKMFGGFFDGLPELPLSALKREMKEQFPLLKAKMTKKFENDLELGDEDTTNLTSWLRESLPSKANEEARNISRARALQKFIKEMDKIGLNTYATKEDLNQTEELNRRLVKIAGPVKTGWW